MISQDAVRLSPKTITAAGQTESRGDCNCICDIGTPLLLRSIPPKAITISSTGHFVSSVRDLAVKIVIDRGDSGLITWRDQAAYMALCSSRPNDARSIFFASRLFCQSALSA